MLYSFAPVIMAHIQFAFTVSAHIFFPDFAIGRQRLAACNLEPGVTDGVTGRDCASIVGAETS